MFHPVYHPNLFYSLTWHAMVLALVSWFVHPSQADEPADSLGRPIPLLGGETIDPAGLDELLFVNPDGGVMALSPTDLTTSQETSNTSPLPKRLSDHRVRRGSPTPTQRSTEGLPGGSCADLKQVDSKPADRVAQAESKREPTASATAKSSPQPKSTVIEPPKPHLKPLTRYEQNLKSRLRRVTAFYRRPQFNTRDHCPWEILHDVIANGTDSQVSLDGPNGKPVTAIGWLCFNRPAHKQQLLHLCKNQLGLKEGPGFQGHNGQFLAALAQAKVMKTYPVRVEGREFTVEDIVRSEQQTCRSGTELTFKLIGLNHYLEPDATWTNNLGETWHIERLVREELSRKINGATCGGTHRLVSLSLAVQKRRKLDLPMTASFTQAAKKVRGYQRYTFQLQNRDGSFSTEWFRGSGDNPDLERRLRTSGHLLEWLVMTMPANELRYPKMQCGVAYIAKLLWEQRHRKWDAGYLCHPVHALNLYDQRIYRPIDLQNQPAAVAKGRPAEPTR